MSEMREGTPEWALAFMEDTARHTLLDEGSGTRELRRAVKIIQSALSQARADALAQGRREGLEEAKEAAERVRDVLYPILNKTRYQDYEVRRYHKYSAGLVVEDIDKLLAATTPAETQKPEESL